MTLINMIWPAIYVASGLIKLWYCIFFTILIESLLLNYFLKFSWKKSLLMSITGNIISGFAGIFIMPIIMLFWGILFNSSIGLPVFHIASWYINFILMCAGSVFIEVFSVKIIFKEPFKKLFLPLLAGNFITYLLIGILALVGVLNFN